MDPNSASSEPSGSSPAFFHASIILPQTLRQRAVRQYYIRADDV
jgi:hypothetical protein